MMFKASAPMLFLDNITNGLDSSTGLQLLELYSQVLHEKERREHDHTAAAEPRDDPYV